MTSASPLENRSRHALSRKVPTNASTNPVERPRRYLRMDLPESAHYVVNTLLQIHFFPFNSSRKRPTDKRKNAISHDLPGSRSVFFYLVSLWRHSGLLKRRFGHHSLAQVFGRSSVFRSSLTRRPDIEIEIDPKLDLFRPQS
jgi:hypothetical protein